MSLSPPPKALIFDVFGTVVDWRTTVIDTLRNEAADAICNGKGIPKDAKATASNMIKPDWDKFSQEWRTSYMTFCRSLAKDPNTPWKSVDQHHYDSLKELLIKWKLEGLWSEDQILELSLVWHKLDPWKDSKTGLDLLAGKFKTATLSNGNATLLKDLVDHGKLAFDWVLSCEEFRTYKPNPKTYLGAAEGLGVKPEECAMVAAHLFDLEAAKKCGLKTIYVARPREEEYDRVEIEEIRKSGVVDIWIEENDSGFLSVARSLGIE
jgi:2-haloacid dehalogenase